MFSNILSLLYIILGLLLNRAGLIIMKNLIIFCKVLLGAIIPFQTNYDISLVDINNVSQKQCMELKAFESKFNYPFSEKERFRIEHGKNGDYFAFFKQLGKPYFFVATCKENKIITKVINNQNVTIEQKAGDIAAVGCSILREIKNTNGKLKKAWYICDLKVNEKYQGEHLPLKITETVAAKRFLQCPRGFAICMNPMHGEPKAAKIFKNHGPFPGLNTQTLNLYTLTKSQVNKLHKAIKNRLVKHGYMKENQKLTYKSTSGMKDYIIFDANSSHRWDLLHIQPDVKGCEPKENAVHMICSVENSQLDDEFKQLIGAPSSTAQIVSFGMQDFDFNFLTTNQI